MRTEDRLGEVSGSEPMWATGPHDTVWHQVHHSLFGSLVCACGHRVLGPVHLRRYRPAAGELGRGHCPTVTERACEQDTDRWLLGELAADETAGRTSIRPPAQHDEQSPHSHAA